MQKPIALQMDALGTLNLRTDSTLYLAEAAVRLGHTLFHYEPANLSLDINGNTKRVMARGHQLLHTPNAATPWALGDEQVIDLSATRAVLMRQDPPFDLGYIAASHILDHLKGVVPVINDPSGVRNAPEKLLLTYFPHLMPPTLISRDAKAIEIFREQQGEIVIKPLFSYGGRGIFHIKGDDNNLLSLIEMLTGLNREPWVVQKFLPVATLGDKRIILFDGKPVAQFLRLPAANDVRSNTRVGGRYESAPLTKRDSEIVETIAPLLQKMGLRFVGIDVIGDYLTEINVTSPTGLVLADKLSGAKAPHTLADLFWQMML